MKSPSLRRADRTPGRGATCLPAEPPRPSDSPARGKVGSTSSVDHKSCSDTICVQARAAEVGDPAEVDQQPPGPFLRGHQGQPGAELPASMGPLRSLVRISTIATSLTILNRRCWRSGLDIDGYFRDSVHRLRGRDAHRDCRGPRGGSGHGLANAPSLGVVTWKSISSVVDASFPSLQRVSLRAIGKPSRV